MRATVLDQSVREFSSGLAAKQPTPGGGSAAALAGALGAGLVSMVCQYTVGRERYADVEEAARRVLARADELRVELEQAVDADVAAYGSYSQAQSMPRETEADQRERHAALQAALRESTEVELGVATRIASLSAGGDTDAAVAAIHELNLDPSVTGILVQLPLPAGLDASAVLAVLDPVKDLDGVSPANAGRFYLGLPALAPAT